jgi:hypothetical protein
MKGSYSFADKWGKTSNFYCNAEDVNNNVILDAGEDINGNGLLEPETPTISAHPDEEPTLIAGTSSLITDRNGFGYLSITYPKSEASWVMVEITATTQDGLPENKDVDEFVLFVSIDDLQTEDDPPAFVNSPYGETADCASTL